MRAVEKYYSVGETALLLGFSERWVRDRINLGEFAGALLIDRDYRVPASGINGWADQHRVRSAAELGVPARSVGELRRKVASGEC